MSNLPDLRRRRRSVVSAALRGLVVVTALAGVALLTGADAHAQADSPAPTPDGADLSNLGLEDLLNVKVYAASRFVQGVAQAPASVTVVAADEIRRHGYRTLADVLRNVRGFYVTYDRDYSYVGVRGFLRPGDFNGRVLLLLNGHRLNDTIYEQGLLGTESPVDVRLLDRVEVIRGPSSSLYGTSAFFAVVNLVTRSGRTLQGTEVELETGSQAMRGGRVTTGGRAANGFEGLFSVSGFAADGNTRIYYPEFDTPPLTTGFAIDADRDQATDLYASASAGRFTMQAGFGSRTKHIPAAPYGTVFNDPRTLTKDVRGFGDVRYNRRLNARTTLELRGAYDEYDYNGDFAYDTGLFLDAGRGSWVTAEGTVVRQLGSHSLTVGSEFRDNLRQDQSAQDETGVLLDDHRRSRTAALYAEDEYRVASRVLVNAGLRWDQYFGIFGGTLNPRVALIVTPFEGGTLKTLYGRAFRAPNPFELYYDQNAISAQLKPERIHTFEVAWEQRVRPRLQLAASVFRNHVFDLITQRAGSDDTLDGLYYRNGDSVTAQGIELELQGELPARMHARVAQVLQSATLDSTDRVISNSPRLLSTIVVDAPVPGTDAIVAFNGFYIADRRRVAGGSVDGAFVGSVSITRHVQEHGLGVGLTLSNVFNASYADPGSVEHRQQVLPQDGRTAAVHLSWRF